MWKCECASQMSCLYDDSVHPERRGNDKLPDTLQNTHTHMERRVGAGSAYWSVLSKPSSFTLHNDTIKMWSACLIIAGANFMCVCESRERCIQRQFKTCYSNVLICVRLQRWVTFNNGAHEQAQLKGRPHRRTAYLLQEQSPVCTI